MDFTVKDRLLSYQPLWNVWNVKRDVYLDKFPNVYEVVNRVSGEVSILKVITIDKDSFAKTIKCSSSDVEQKLFTIIGSIVDVNILRECNRVAKYDDYLIRGVIQDGEIVGYDIIFRIDHVECLHSKFKSGVKFTQRSVVSMLYSVGKVLSTAHAKGLIHKYINPQTLFLDVDGLYMVGDFGIYSLLSTRKDTTYSAPEVLNGKKNTIESDVYSLGLVAYQMLNGNKFVKPNDGETLPVVSGVNSSLMWIVQKMCAYDPSERYSTVQELLTDLRENVKLPQRKKKFQDHEDREDTAILPKIPVVNDTTLNKSSDTIPTMEEVTEEESRRSVLPAIIMCVVIGFIVCIFGTILYKSYTGAFDTSEMAMTSSSIEDTTTIPTTTAPTTTTTTPMTTYSHVVLTVTETSTTPPTTTTTKATTTTPLTTTTKNTTTIITTTTPPPTTTTKVTTSTTPSGTTTSKATTSNTSNGTTTTPTPTTTITTTKSPNVKHTYAFKQGAFTWEEAYADATANGHQLATFTNADELEAIRSVAKSSGLKYFWLGGKVNIYTDDTNTSYAYCYWQNGDDNTFLNSSGAKWYYSEKYAVQEPSGWDVNTNELEPYIMLWYLDDWTLCDNSNKACTNSASSGYIYMD
jgi:serine/threonine protein kinase